MLISQKIELIRNAVGITTQLEMAKSLGLEQSSYSDIVRGKTKKLSGSVLKLLEIVHNVNMGYLLGNDKNMFKSSTMAYKQVSEPLPQYGDSNIAELEIRHLKEKIRLLEEQIELYKNLLKDKK